MSALNNFTKMLESVGARYSKTNQGENVTVLVPTSQGGRVETVFSNGGEHFLTSMFRVDGKFRVHAGSVAEDSGGQPTSESNDYAVLLAMIANAPVSMGEWFEAESQDGQYIGIIYYDNTADYGTAFVCAARSKKFLGVVGC